MRRPAIGLLAAVACGAVALAAGCAGTPGPGHVAGVPAAGPASPGTGADPATVVPAAWLTAGQLPFGAGLIWGPYSSPAIRVMTAPVNNLGVCLSGDPRQVGAGPAWQVSGGAFAARSAPHLAVVQAYEVQYFYRDAAAARRGLAAFEEVYAHCQGAGTSGIPDLIDRLRVTVRAPGRFAMLRTLRHRDGKPASAPAVGSDSHEYLVLDGNVIYFLGIYGGPAIDGSGSDPRVLASMSGALAHYSFRLAGRLEQDCRIERRV